MTEQKTMLHEKLLEYTASDAYPFHMPGHKRQLKSAGDPYQMDITEIGGFDNLHHAEGILKEAQQRAADFYGADRTFYLVNGSTCGILAAISTATKKGDRVLVARNCHKSVYHALYLRQLQPVYLFPTVTEQGLQGQLPAECVKRALEEEADIAAVILTSPTYDGMVSDIAEISAAAHQRNIPVIVDEAHGAHFALSDLFPTDALQAGADAVVAGIHKTLPAFTQTALLHLKGDRLNEERVQEFLDIYETSSPSYLLMSGIERCINMVTMHGREMSERLCANLKRFYSDVRALQHLRVLQPDEVSPEDAFAYDFSKIIIFSGDRMTGEELQEILRREYGIETEMACRHYVLTLASVMDTQEGFLRLSAALSEIDKRYDLLNSAERSISDSRKDCRSHIESIYRPMERAMEISDALEAKRRRVNLKEAKGQISASYVLTYPPGIPLIVPGEVIDQRLTEAVVELLRTGLCVEGLTEEGIYIVNSGRLYYNETVDEEQAKEQENGDQGK